MRTTPTRMNRMNNSRTTVAIFVTLLTALIPIHAAIAANIGFAPSGISFSNDTAFAGTATKVYTVVVNNQYPKLSATVSFIDNGREFARTNVQVEFEEARQVSVIWTPTEGSHVVGARFVSATATDAQGTIKQLSANEIDAIGSPVSKSTVIDNDSDKDGIGDHDEISTYHTAPLKFDTDDDGLGDNEEIFKYKTDPNNPNTDGDNMNDGDEVHAGRNPLVKDDPLPPPPPPQVVAQPIQQKSEPVVAPQQQAAPIAEKQKTTTPSKEPAQKKSSAKIPELAPVLAAEATSTIETATTTEEIATSTPTTTLPIAPAQIEPEESGSWITVLGVIAGLFAVGAAVSGALAWREQNRY